MARLIVVAEATWGAIYLKPESQSGKANVIIAVSVTNADGVAVTGLSTVNFDVHFMPAPGYNPKFLQAFTIPVEEQVPGIYVLALGPPNQKVQRTTARLSRHSISQREYEGHRSAIHLDSTCGAQPLAGVSHAS